MKIILLEGCDGTGKTTLKNELVEYIENQGYTVDSLHFGPYPTPEDAYTDYLTKIWDHDSVQYLVIDRLYISERIYGQVYHGRWASDEMFKLIERLLSQYEPIVIYTEIDWGLVAHNWENRLDSEMIKDPEQLHQVYLKYKEIDAMTSFPVIPYDFTDCNFDCLINYFKENNIL